MEDLGCTGGSRTTESITWLDGSDREGCDMYERLSTLFGVSKTRVVGGKET